MPWTTPNLVQVRSTVRDYVSAGLKGAPMIPNSVLRVISDAQGGLAHLVLVYIDWLSLQLLPDTAETVWLDRHGNIWLVNADGSKGRKPATYSSGSVTITGSAVGLPIPQYSQLSSATNGIVYEITDPNLVLGATATPANIRALTSGAAGNLDPGSVLGWQTAIAGVDPGATVVSLVGGTDQENDTDLRGRVLQRIQQPPMGGDADDYVAWAESVAGVTRAWCYPQEMGIGTVTVRFMMDELRASNGGFPLAEDVTAVQSYIDTVRPVTVQDFWVEAPIPFPLNMTITGMNPGDAGTQANVEDSITAMLVEKALTGQTIYHAWVDGAINDTPGVNYYELSFVTTPMSAPGYMPTLGTVTFA